MKIRFAVQTAFLAVILLTSFAEADIKLGILAQRTPEITLKEWEPLGDFLTNKLGEKVTIVPLAFEQVLDFCRDEPGGFLFANSWFIVRAKVHRKAEPLATANFRGSGPVFGGVIFVRRDSEIASVEDVRNKTLMCMKFSSPGGWLFQKGVLITKGIHPEKDCKRVLEGHTHDEVVNAVRVGRADVGMVRTNMLETLEREGKIKIKDFRILNETSHPNFPEVCSTPLYPDWTVASLRATPPELAAKVKAILLSIPPRHPALEQPRNKLDGFVEPVDHAPLAELLKFLKVEPFKKGE
ncbi:MAG: phosphate/phosphite/phosphonate ABC transporter substrate-binding protein [Desulfomonile tiedjei]|uniref:Phosphate/phosphite/phosphonate ABC transporter substrate-binding protein n=1 Tax=Desulfomonile tiedjei TaxID=2358 RepID=A0A9D6UY98_9BACT|nr:phosphate/phosphite/phosphonate ABC transporter substrate-binding protein [Desulfomonile tiedjei]